MPPLPKALRLKRRLFHRPRMARGKVEHPTYEVMLLVPQRKGNADV